MKPFRPLSRIRAAWLAVVLLAAMAVLVGSQAHADNKGLTVVELFTSQGCSSCPPADRFIGELAQEEGILALSFNVTYWDYIGWKDVFARPEFTKRQRAYANSLNLRHVYTPQMVVNGAVEGVGSRRGLVRDMIKKQGRLAGIPVHLMLDDANLKVNVPQSAKAANTVVNVVIIDREHETRIERGENRGKIVTNYNTVRALKKVGEWSGQAIDLTIPLVDLGHNGGDGYAALLQDKESDRIIGAGVLWINGS